MIVSLLSFLLRLRSPGLVGENDRPKSGQSLGRGPRVKFESQPADKETRGSEGKEGDEEIDDEEADEEQRCGKF